MIHDPLHNYQRGVLISFVVSLVIFVLYISLQLPGVTIAMEKTIGAAWLTLYTLYCFQLRAKVADKENISAYKFPLIHWALLGITMIYVNVVRPSDFQFLYPIVNIGFIIFTLFSADAHWDFKRLPPQ